MFERYLLAKTPTIIPASAPLIQEIAEKIDMRR